MWKHCVCRRESRDVVLSPEFICCFSVLWAAIPKGSALTTQSWVWVCFFLLFFFPIPFYLITWINCQIVCSGTSSSPREPDGQISRKLNRTERAERSTVLPTETPPAPRAPLAVVCTSEPSPRKSKLCRKLSCANLGQALICRQAKRKLAQVFFFFFFFYLLRWVKLQCSLLELFYFNSQRGCWRSFDFISVNLSW